MQLTKEALEKLIHYRQRPIDWIQDNVTVVHPARGIVPFEMYEFQKKAINLLLAKHFVITLKSRQVGMSTVSQAYILWCALHYSGYKILILSATQRNAIKFLDDIKGMYERIPDDQKSKITIDKSAPREPGKKRKRTNNKTEIEFENGSKIMALPGRSPAARGASVNLLIIDECAFIKGIRDTFNGLYSTLSRAFTKEVGKPYGIIIISTPNGIEGDGNFYYEKYMDAVAKKNRFIPMRIHWSEVDEYDLDWYIEQCSTVGWDYRLINSELELSFLSSGNTYIPGKILDVIGVERPKAKSPSDELWIFKEPIPGRKYIIGVDYAYGNNKDASAIQVLDAWTLEQVAEYISAKVITSRLAQVIIQLSEKYNRALTNIERNAGGKVLIERILEESPIMHTRLYRDSNIGDVMAETPKFGKLFLNTDAVIGTLLTGTSRDIILSNMYTLLMESYIERMPEFDGIEENIESIKAKFIASAKTGGVSQEIEVNSKIRGIVKSERLLFQLLGFIVDKSGKPQGKKDDAVLAYSHALYAWTKSKKFLLQDVAAIMENLTPDHSDFRLESEKRFVLEMTRNLNNNISEKELDRYITELEQDDNFEINNDSFKSRTAAIWDAFLY